MTRIAIVGVAGRMGRTLVNAVQQDDGATLAGGIVEPGSTLAEPISASWRESAGWAWPPWSRWRPSSTTSMC